MCDSILHTADPILHVRNQLIAELIDIGVVKRGDFTLKSGKESPYYFDFRLLISYPSIYTKLVDFFLMKHPEFFDEVKLLTGIHFGGIPLANYISTSFNIPQIYIHDSPKEHGTQRQIEGDYVNSLWKDRVAVVDDVLTTGTSIREKYAVMEAHGLDIQDIIVILDRREASERSANRFIGIKETENGTRMVPVFSILTIEDFDEYIHTPIPRSYYPNKVANCLFELSVLKRTNIVVAADLPKLTDILDLIERIHPYIAGVKLHSDTLPDFSLELVNKLCRMSIDYQFIIIEDRKLADIGAIGFKQLGGHYRIGEWADAVTVHTITGLDQINAIYKEYPSMGLIPIAELSSRGNLIDRGYVDESVYMTRNHPALCGYIAQSRIYSYMSPFEAITFSPGIHLDATTDNNGQQYRNKGLLGKYWIVGRGIYDNEPEQQVEMAKNYAREGWNSFWHRVR